MNVVRLPDSPPSGEQEAATFLYFWSVAATRGQPETSQSASSEFHIAQVQRVPVTEATVPDHAEYYAHSLQGRPLDEWEPLCVHLRRVARLAAKFGAAFASGRWACVAGLWHDLGKYSPEFRAYLFRQNGFEAHLEDQPGRVDHSTAGARHAAKAGPGGRLLAHCIAGHHCGLSDEADLLRRMEKPNLPPIDAAPAALLSKKLPPPPPLPRDADPARMAFRYATWCRMLFSALVDADFLATEVFYSPDRAAQRRLRRVSMRELESTVLEHLAAKAIAASDSDVNRHRAGVLDACLRKAELPPGLFSLSVPTGGGKTLSSLAFALRHARLHDLRRIVYAIPFTSIIEQNADVFRRALGIHSDLVLEHHSNLEPQRETVWSRLAGENWDAPLVVTTNVQLFESLFASRTSRCRKLHRLAGSVIILDEAQTIPVEVLHPCLAVLRELVVCYGATVVLCTATQPAVKRRDDFGIGLENVTEIIADREELYAAMQRVETTFVGKLDDAELVRRLSAHEQALCVVNTRAHAAKLYTVMPDQSRCVHLSALMCPRHRSATIACIKRRLKQGRPCVVISTQLVEAGVDLDFPVVYRAIAGVDSIAQAAGRCNREGRLERGQVFVFEPEAPVPPGQRHAADSARDVIGRFDDLLGLEAIEQFFLLHYWRRSNVWDAERVMSCFALSQGRPPMFNFSDAAMKFKMIKEGAQRPVIVPWGPRGWALRELIISSASDRDLPTDIHRRAQRFIVQIPEHAWQKLIDDGDVGLYGSGDSLPVLLNQGLYDDRLGLRISAPGAIAPEFLTF